MKKTNKKSVVKKTWVAEQLDRSEKEFETKSKELIWQLTEGGGIKNIHIFDTIRSLEFIYLKCGAYGLAARDEKS